MLMSLLRAFFGNRDFKVNYFNTWYQYVEKNPFDSWCD